MPMSLSRKIRYAVQVALDTRYWAFFMQRQTLNPIARARNAVAAARKRPNACPARENSSALSRQLEVNGYADLGRVLDAKRTAEVRSYFAAARAQDPYRPHLPPVSQPSDAAPETHVAYYPSEVVAAAPHLLSIANSPVVLGAVSEYLGCKPTISYMAAWWSIAGHTEPDEAEWFHRDVDDWRLVKFFVYLTDVDQSAGPHVYVKGSHTVASLLPIRRYTDDEVVSEFGADSLHTWLGDAGVGFLEDTFALHRGLPAEVRHRLAFQVVYSIGIVPYGPRTPINLIADGYDKYINRVYFK
jgi:hypothetical protein